MAVAREPTGTLGDLYLIPISPWSRRTLLTLLHTRAPVTVIEYKVPISEYAIWARLRFASRKITAPAFFPQNGADAIMESEDIARILDAARAPDAHTLFPAQHDDAIRVLCKHAETVSFFWRAELIRTVSKDAATARRLLLPEWLRGVPLLGSLSLYVVSIVDRKYAVESSCTEEEVRNALTAISHAVAAAPNSGFPHLVGGSLTYADIVVGLSLNLLCNDSTSPLADKTSHPIANEFAEVKEWGDTFLRTYATPDAMSFPPPTFAPGGARAAEPS